MADVLPATTKLMPARQGAAKANPVILALSALNFVLLLVVVIVATGMKAEVTAIREDAAAIKARSSFFLPLIECRSLCRYIRVYALWLLTGCS